LEVMIMTVLIAYATDHGSTGGIAARVADRLRQRGADAEACAVSEVQDVSGYAAVVLGSAIHGGKWLPEARQFADRCAGSLRERPVWLFSVSTLGDEESMFPARVANRLHALRKETPEITQLRRLLQAREHRNFAGAIARSDWPAAGRAFFRATGGRYGDHRNWTAIDAWADLIASQLDVRSGVLGSDSPAGAVMPPAGECFRRRWRYRPRTPSASSLRMSM
jgi:menaquinone-dependent protoporphyrinogen oxidase